MAEKVIRVALAGNPNVGKTTLFNQLTGENLKVGNWPGVTVEKVIGKKRHKGRKLEIVDLPGTYSLTAYSIDEVIARNYIIEEEPDVVLHVVDPSNIGRNLYLTFQLMELQCRMILVLNMWDRSKKLDYEIDTEALSGELGIPVVTTSSTTGEGIGDLLDTIVEEAGAGATCGKIISFRDPVERKIREVSEALYGKRPLPGYQYRWLAIKALEGDDRVWNRLEKSGLENDARKAIGKTDPMDMEIAITDGRYSEVDRVLGKVLKRKRIKERASDLIDSVVTNKYLGIPIFLVLIWSIFRLTFEFAQPFSDLIDILFANLSDLITENLQPEWLASMLGEGVIGGVGAVLVFLPNILVLFFLISILESSGYMARAAFVMDRIMSKIGLSGKSFIPMVIGFGCNVPAIMAARSIDDRKDRLVTILVNPFVSCGARLPVYILLAGIFFEDSGGMVIFGLYILGIIVAILSAKLFRMTILKGEPSPFIMELPQYRGPDLKLSLKSTWEKGSQYMKKAGTVILLGSIIVWFLASFSLSLERVDYGSASSMAGSLGKLIAPVMDPLGFDWKISIALIFGFVAKEIVVGSLGVLYNVGEDDAALTDRLAADSGLTSLGGMSLMVFVLLYVPCIATVGAIKQETGSWAWTIFSIVYSMSVAYLVALLVYQGGLLLGL